MSGERPRDASTADWVAVLAGGLGALMATLDISITNSALPQIQGEVGASGTEGTWIGTGYLVAEIIMIPLTAWLTRVFGLRNLLLGCAGLFMISSIICGMSNDLTTMIIGRVGQGFTGGAMIPTAQTIIATRLPNHQRPIGMTLFGLIVLLGPLAGPITGGYLAEHISWRWCFFVNLPVGVGLITLLFLGLQSEKMHVERLWRADWLGIVGLALGLGCLTIVLEEGQRNRWFESQEIVNLALISITGFIIVAVSQFTSRDPVVKLSLLKNRSYAGAVFLILIVGMVLYGVIYLLPQFLAGIAGYNAEQSGVVMLIAGAPAFLMIPFLPRLLGTVDIRYLVGAGLACLSASCFLDTHLTAQSVGHDFTMSQILRGFGQVLCMFPLNQASVGSVPRDQAGDAAGLFNMARNLGGSIGLASIGAFIDWRNSFHADVLRTSVQINSPLVQQRMADMAASATARTGDPFTSQLSALGRLAGMIAQQSAVLTFSECFFVLGFLVAACLPLILLVRSPKGGPAAAAH